MRRIFFVDDHPIYRDGFRRALIGGSEDTEVVDAEGVRAAMSTLACDDAFDLCLVDQNLADGEGLALALDIRRRYPAMAVGLLCADVRSELVAEVRRMGGVACLAKSRDAASLCSAVDALFRGELVFDERVSSIAGDVDMSPRKREVLELASLGMQDKQIGKALAISESTVRHHWKQIFIRLGAGNRAEAVSKAHQTRLLRQSEPRRNVPPR